MTRSASSPVARSPSALTRAILWMVLSLFSFSAIAIAGRAAAKGMTTTEMIFWRSIIGIVALALVYRSQGARPDAVLSQRMPLHLMRSLIHYTAQYSWLYALTLIPMAELFALEFTSPLWVAVLAPVFLGERLTGWRVVAACVGFIGALLVVEPGLFMGQLQMTASTGSLFAAFSAFGFASSMIFTKTLTRTDPALRILFWMQVWQAVISAIVLCAVGMSSGVWSHSWFASTPLAIWMWVTVLSIAGLGAHLGLTRAFALADAIIVAPMDFLRLPLIAVVGAMFYGETLRTSVAFGAAIVVAGNALNMWAERRAQATARKR